MPQEPHIYAVIIGTEILEGRRQDKHFNYLRQLLEHKGRHLFASFVIKDNADLIRQTYELIKADKNALMFSFGGIGSTPDDLTRQLSAEVFSDGRLYRNPTFEQAIIERLQERAYPHPIKMSDLPKDAGLLFNPVNNMSGFQLDERYFFMPGFPEMAQPMMDHIVSEYISHAPTKYTMGFIAQCGEGKIQELMFSLPDEIELSSLPMIKEGKANVEFRLSATDQLLLTGHFKRFTDFLDDEMIGYTLL